MAFIKLQKYYGFTLTIERFGEGAENLASFLNELADKEDMGYNAMCSTVLTPEIGDAVRRVSERIPTVTYNTTVSSIPKAIEYVGSGSLGEEGLGFNLAIHMGLFILKHLGNGFLSTSGSSSASSGSSSASSGSSSASSSASASASADGSGSGSASASSSASASASADGSASTLTFRGIKNDSSLREEFIDRVNSYSNVLVISHSEDVDNTAFTDRHRGVTRIFENAIYYRDFDELKAKVSEHLSLHEGNTPIVLGMCLQGSVLDSLNEFLEQQTSLIYYLGVTDITSSLLSQLNDPTTSLVAVSGFPPIAQGNLVSAALLNKVYGIFGGDVSTLKLYTPIGNADVNAEETALTVKEED